MPHTPSPRTQYHLARYVGLPLIAIAIGMLIDVVHPVLLLSMAAPVVALIFVQMHTARCRHCQARVGYRNVTIRGHVIRTFAWIMPPACYECGKPYDEPEDASASPKADRATASDGDEWC